MKYSYLTIVLTIGMCCLTGCTSTGTYWKYDSDGNIVEHHRWKMKGDQITEVPGTFKTDTKQKSPLEDLITIKDAKLVA